MLSPFVYVANRLKQFPVLEQNYSTFVQKICQQTQKRSHIRNSRKFKRGKNKEQNRLLKRLYSTTECTLSSPNNTQIEKACVTRIKAKADKQGTPYSKEHQIWLGNRIIQRSKQCKKKVNQLKNKKRITKQAKQLHAIKPVK